MSLRLWAMAVGHGVAVGAQGHQVRLGIHLALVLGEGLDVVDLDVTVRVVIAVGLVEIEGAHSAGGPLSLDRLPAVLLASLVRDVQDQALAPLAVGVLREEGGANT